MSCDAASQCGTTPIACTRPRREEDRHRMLSTDDCPEVLGLYPKRPYTASRIPTLRSGGASDTALRLPVTNLDNFLEGPFLG